MEHRRLVGFGFALVVAMQVIFVATGGDRGPLYEAVNAVGVAATALALFGLTRADEGSGLLAAGGSFALLALLRVLNVALDLTRIALPISILMALGWGLAAYGAFAWGATRRPHAGLLGAGVWILGGAYFLALGETISSGRLSAIVALLLGTVGFLLAAPNVDGVSASSSG